MQDFKNSLRVYSHKETLSSISNKVEKVLSMEEELIAKRKQKYNLVRLLNQSMFIWL